MIRTKDMDIEIKRITSSEVLPIRHKVMWPNKPIEYVKLQNDKSAKHFGLVVNGEVISIISLFTVEKEVQFRKFATLPEFQGFGYGTALLKNVIDLTKKEGFEKLWCNARVEKIKFYESFSLKSTNKKFEKDGVQYVIMEHIFYQSTN